MPKLTLHATFHGPNPYAAEPVVVVTFAWNDSTQFDLASQRIASASRGWFTMPAKLSGDLELRAAEFLAAWSLALLNKTEPLVEAGGARRMSDGVRVWAGFHHPNASLHALSLGAKLLQDAHGLSETQIQQEVDRFGQQVFQVVPDFQAAILIRYARAARLPWTRVAAPGRIWQFGQGFRSAKFFESQPMEDSYIGLNWAKDKEATKQIFAELGAPIAPGVVVTNVMELSQAAEKVGFPCVVKPLDRGRSIGVTTYVSGMPALQEAFWVALKESRAVMVERHVEGEVHRLLVIRGKFWKAIRRNRPAVVADGKRTVSALLRELNEARRQSGVVHPLMALVPEDQEFQQTLRSQGLTPSDVPAAGRRVRLRNIPLLATGADYEDVTDQLHPATRATCEAMADYFGCASCGIDFITEDVTRSCHELGTFLELNGTPGLRVPIIAGISPDEVARVILGDQVGRIPTLLVVAPSARHAQLRQLLPEDMSIGWACGGDAGIGSTRLSGQRAVVHQSVATVLRQRRVRGAIVITDPAEIFQHGLPLDFATQVLIFDAPELPAEWRDLLRHHAEHCEATSDLERAAGLVAEVTRSSQGPEAV